MLTAVKSSHNFLHQVEEVNYLTISQWTEAISQSIDHYDAILITTSNQQHFEELVLNIRTHTDKSFYLKPLFYKYPTTSTYSRHTDGLFQEAFSNQIAEKINLKASELQDVHATSTEQQISIQTLQYLYTRDGQLLPAKSRISKINYQFPFIDLFYTGNEFSVVGNLQKLHKEGFLENQLKDRVQLCHDCHDGFMVFKETCPKCNAINIAASDVIHHFVCAHVAPEAQFKNDENDELSCPKCDKHLRHIGIDYDKPSSVYHCNQCDHDFQQAAVVAECHSCNKKNQFDELIEVNINDYKLTMKGITIAKNGTFKATNAAPVSQEIIFHEIVKHEAERCRIHQSSTYIVDVEIKSPFFAMLDAQYKEKFWNEIKQVIKNYTSFSSHILIRKNQVLFLLLETSAKEAEEVTQRLHGNLNILMEDNLGGNVKISTQAHDITTWEK